MMNTTITLDIETIGTQRQDVRDYIAATIKPPGTIKLPASIEKWNKESKTEAVDEAISKTGLDGAFGQIVCIGYDLDDSGHPSVIFGLDEPVLLAQFNEVLSTIPSNMHSAMQIVGHNVLQFDIRFLWQRFIVNGIRPHPIINMAVNAKAWDNKVYDTMIQFAGHGNRISLDKLCLALRVPSSKTDMDGSMVGQAVADGRIEEVAEYCKRDVAATRECFKRMTFA